jgi:hypothetical protein
LYVETDVRTNPLAAIGFHSAPFGVAAIAQDQGVYRSSDIVPQVVGLGQIDISDRFVDVVVLHPEVHWGLPSFGLKDRPWRLSQDELSDDLSFPNGTNIIDAPFDWSSIGNERSLQPGAFISVLPVSSSYVSRFPDDLDFR